MEMIAGAPPILGSSLKEHMLLLTLGKVPNTDGPHSSQLKTFVRSCLNKDHIRVSHMQHLRAIH